MDFYMEAIASSVKLCTISRWIIILELETIVAVICKQSCM